MGITGGGRVTAPLETRRVAFPVAECVAMLAARRARRGNARTCTWPLTTCFVRAQAPKLVASSLKPKRTHLVSCGPTGMGAATCCHPLDVIRVQMQVKSACVGVRPACEILLDLHVPTFSLLLGGCARGEHCVCVLCVCVCERETHTYKQRERARARERERARESYMPTADLHACVPYNLCE